MILLRLLGVLGALVFAGAAAVSPARALTDVGVLLAAGASALVALGAVVTLNRWLLALAGLAGLATLAVVAPGPWAALAMGLGVLFVLHAVTTLRRIRGYATRVGPDTVRQAVSAHQRNLPGPLVVLAAALVGIAAAPWLLGQLVDAGAPASLELAGVIGLVVPGLVVLALPVLVGAWRARGGGA